MAKHKKETPAEAVENPEVTPAVVAVEEDLDGPVLVAAPVELDEETLVSVQQTPEAETIAEEVEEPVHYALDLIAPEPEAEGSEPSLEVEVASLNPVDLNVSVPVENTPVITPAVDIVALAKHIHPSYGGVQTLVGGRNLHIIHLDQLGYNSLTELLTFLKTL